ncbi:hypothetical protein RJ639_020037 [Escallonia herrerae]|uniref:Uncharacterized protein n=1 Tax=Escallonia herrerae TaxID=1293975 RepID=A0AA88VA47_9ASTE|nr:hypothetical protein RJ639_020037 [Escallonia herrerae]
MSEPRSYDGAREARQVDNFFWCLELYFEALNIDDEEEQVQRTVASQVELIFNRLDDLEVDSRLTVLEWKVDVFAEELDDLIEERVAHFTKWEVQRCKDLKGQVTELQEELAACKKELTKATRQGCIAVEPRQKKMPEPRSYNGARKARQVDNFFWHFEWYFEALDIDDEEEKKSKEEAAKEKKSKKRWGLLYPTVNVAEKTQEVLVDTRATHNFISLRVAKWLGLKPTKDRSWFTVVNTEERPMKGVIKNVDLRTDRWTWKADFNIIDMDELGVVLGMDFMEKLSATLNSYYGVMMMVSER